MESFDDDDDDDEPVPKRQTYKDSVASKIFLDSGVKKLFIIGLAESTQENYENVEILWSIIEVNKFLGTIAVDLKLANILSGLMPHSCSHPCTFCFATKNKLNERGEFRTIGNTISNYQDWQASGSKKSKAKDYGNCIQMPVFSGDSDQLILDIITPPELHLMIGVVNTIYDHMIKEFNEDALQWAKACNVDRDVTYSGSSFNGNSCKRLLNKIDVLRANCSIGCVKFVKCLDDFGSVVSACFGKRLHSDFVEKIEAFKQSYLDLNISVTPKVHGVFYHVIDFCTKHEKGLGLYSEQAMEAVHFEFKSFWSKYKLNSSHEKYPEHLLRTVREFNSLHV